MDVHRNNKKPAGHARQPQPARSDDDLAPRGSTVNIAHAETSGENNGRCLQSQRARPDPVPTESTVNIVQAESPGKNERHRHYGNGACMLKSVTVSSAQLVLSGSLNKVYFTCPRRRGSCYENGETDSEVDEGQTPVKRRRLSSIPTITPHEAARLASSRTPPRPTITPNSRQPQDPMTTPGVGLFSPAQQPQAQSSRGEEREAPRQQQQQRRQLEEHPSENEQPQLQLHNSEVVVVEQNTETPNSITVVDGIIASLERRAGNRSEVSDNDRKTKRLSLKRKAPKRKLFTQREPTNDADDDDDFVVSAPFQDIYQSSRDPRVNPALHLRRQQTLEYPAVESENHQPQQQQQQADSELSDLNVLSADLVQSNFFNTDM